MGNTKSGCQRSIKPAPFRVWVFSTTLNLLLMATNFLKKTGCLLATVPIHALGFGPNNHLFGNPWFTHEFGFFIINRHEYPSGIAREDNQLLFRFPSAFRSLL